MKAILLCAGYATRLYPLTKDRPKPLLPIRGIPIINYLVDQLAPIEGLDGIHVVTNSRFFDSFRKWQSQYYAGRKIEVINDKTTSNENRLGAIRDIRFVIDQKKIEDDLLVLAGDNLFDFNLEDFIREALSHRPHSTLAVYDVGNRELAKRYGLVAHDASGKITAFFEKPAKPKTTLASTGIYFFPKESLCYLNEYLKTQPSADAPGHYVHWLARQTKVFVFSFRGSWYDIGDLESYQKAEQDFPGRLTRKVKAK